MREKLTAAGVTAQDTAAHLALLRQVGSLF
jgi:hypothetical protein